MYKLSKFIIPTEIINNKKQKTNTQQRIIYSTITNNSIKIEEKYYEHLIKGEFSKIDQKYLDILKSTKILINKDVNELSQILKENDLTDSKTLSIILHSTSNCQLNCSYCGQNHTNNFLTENTSQEILQLINNELTTGNYNRLIIIWHGSEPLLGYPYLLKLSRKIVTLTTSLNIVYGAKLITNGLRLKSDLFKSLVDDCKIFEYQLTLDGDKEFHDKHRYTKGNKGSFDLIFNNISEIIQFCKQENYNEVNLQIRINIDRINQQGITQLIDKLAMINSQQIITFDFRPVENYADNRSNESYGYTSSEFAVIELEYILYSIKQGFRLVDFLPRRSF